MPQLQARAREKKKGARQARNIEVTEMSILFERQHIRNAWDDVEFYKPLLHQCSVSPRQQWLAISAMPLPPHVLCPAVLVHFALLSFRYSTHHPTIAVPPFFQRPAPPCFRVDIRLSLCHTPQGCHNAGFSDQYGGMVAELAIACFSSKKKKIVLHL